MEENQTSTPSVEKVLIPLDEYKKLLEDAHFLECLIEHDVEMWHKWDYAMELHNSHLPQFLQEKLAALGKPLKR